MRGGPVIGAAETQSLVHAGVNQRVVDDEIPALRKRGEQRRIRGIAGGEEQRALAPEEARSLFLQSLVLGMVAAQQPRSARPQRDPTGNRFGNRRRESGGASQPEIIV